MSNNNLESLMRDVARAVAGDVRRREILPDLQRRLAEQGVAEQRRSRLRSRVGWRLTLVGAAAGAAVLAFVLLRPQPLSYSVSVAAGEGERMGHIGDPLVGPTTGALALRFSDGSEVTLPARAQARVAALDTRGATVAVEDGTVEVSVRHRERTRWEVRAGRYQIHVTGTRFSAGWDARAQRLTVTMHEGSVAVTGPGLREPVRVVTGQRLRANAVADPAGDEPLVSPVFSIENADAPERPAMARTRAHAGETPPPGTGVPGHAEVGPGTPALPPVREVRAAPPARLRHAVLAPRAVAAPRALARAEADWHVQAAHARYRDALASAVREGWTEDCDRLGAEDVVLLGDVARLGGDLPRAEEAYQSARRRFPSADRPVYGLGLVAFEGRHDYAQAARLFDAYLRSFPRGALVREAAGRLLEARLKAGESGAAREAAANYLRAYPDGPHAALARRTVGP